MKKQILLFLSGCLYLFYGCGGIEQKDFVNMYETPINIPDDLRLTFNGKDTLIGSFSCSPMKLCIYIDSLQCSPCYVSSIMANWSEYMDYAEQTNGLLSIYFIFCPKKEKSNELLIALTVTKINYPIFIDTAGRFGKTNSQILKNELFHCFLIDSANKVIHIGAPTVNEQMKQLFYKNSTNELRKININRDSV